MIREALRTLAKPVRAMTLADLKKESGSCLPNGINEKSVAARRASKHVANQEGDAKSRKRSKQIEKT